MPFSSDDVLEVTCKLNFDGISAIRNIYHLQAVNGSSGADEDICDDIAAYMSTMYASIDSLFPDNVNAETIKVVNLTEDRVMGEVAWTAAFEGGEGTSNSLALGVAAVIRMATAVRGCQGRKFIGPLQVAMITDDALIGTSYLTSLATFAAYMLGNITAEGAVLQFVVWRRIAMTAAAIGEVIVNAIPGYQRRRKQNVGE